MIKITNLNFKELTVGSVEVDCENISNVEYTMTHEKFTVTCHYYSEGVELIEEQVIENQLIEEEDQIIETSYTLKKIKEKLYENLKKNTADTYYRLIEQLHAHFKWGLFLNLSSKQICEYIESNWNSNSTIKTKLCAIKKIYEIIQLDTTLFEKRIKHYLTLNKIDVDKKDYKKPIQEGEELLEHFNQQMILLEKEKDYQYFCLLKIYLTLGVLRRNELLYMKVLDTDTDEKMNYINVNTKQIIIRNHKTETSQPQRIINIYDESLLNALGQLVNQYLITDKKGELYKTPSTFSKHFKSKFGYTTTDLRKAKVSQVIQEADPEKIETLSQIHGHSITTQLGFYNKYSLIDSDEEEIVLAKN